MSTELTRRSTTALASAPELLEQAKSYVEQAKAPNTRRAYAADWQHFTQWCDGRQLASLPAPPETVVLYITDQAGRCKVATLGRRLVAISQVHQAARLDSPTVSIAVREVMKGIRRAHGTAQTQKAPAVLADLRAMLATLPDSLLGTRDRALLLIGFAGAFRRSELVSFDRKDVQFSREGASLHLRHSKTDQEGQGQLVAIPYGMHPDTCPVKALQAWLRATGITDGPIFRPIGRHSRVAASRLTSQTVAAVVKRAALAAGLDPALYAGHSLRAGLATQAAASGVEERDIMRQTRHKSVTIARRYIRQGTRWQNNAAGKVGL